jgi:signal transduction histidine kinase
VSRPPALRGFSRSDIGIPAALALITTLEFAALGYRPPVVAALPSWVACLFLVWRRRWPLVTAPAAGLALATEPYLNIPTDEASSGIAIVGVACYALGRHVPDLRGLAGLGIIQLAIWTLGNTTSPSGIRAPTLSDIAFVGALTVAPWAFGRVVLAHARSGEALRARARRLEEEKERAAREAIRVERARIARELHDVIAHALSLMVVQAGAAHDLVRKDPERAARAMSEVQHAGRRALSETGRLLDLIRNDEELGLAPQPTAGDLAALIQEFRDSGLEVDLDVDSSTDHLPPGVDLSVYRIVQEGLTNALKHARGARTHVRFRHLPNEVLVDITNEGGPTASTWESGGHGLIGMRERVSVFGGTLHAGPTADGGFTLQARLPAPEDA